MRFLGVSVGGLEINGESYGLVAGFDKRYVGVVILMLGKNSFVFVGLRKREDFREQVNFKNLRYDLGIRGNRVNTFENINESFDSPLTVISADVIF